MFLIKKKSINLANFFKPFSILLDTKITFRTTYKLQASLRKEKKSVQSFLSEIILQGKRIQIKFFIFFFILFE